MFNFKTKLVLTIFLAASDVYASDDYLRVPECSRPAVGTTTGACAVRSNDAWEVSSPFPLTRWIACLQSSKHLPSGGYGDAVFFSYMVPEYEREIEANLLALNGLLSTRDKRQLQTEQKRWKISRERAEKRRAAQPSPNGTMYMMFSASVALDAPQQRALELACRVEKIKRSLPPE